jgi:uncharacterized damage-inducible protein DinB
MPDMVGAKPFDSFVFLIERDLRKLEAEIQAYPDDDLIWVISNQIKNSAGTLALHLCGNLRHYIGTILGGTGYVRNREREFADRNVPKKELVRQIAETRNTVIKTLNSLDSNILSQRYPEKVFEYEMTTGHFLIHLCAHLGYHLGQVNYHRRLTTNAE